MKTYKDILGTDFKEGMTAEEIEALICQRYKALVDSESKLKTSLTNANSDAANWKKKYQETLSEEEQKRIAQQEEYNALVKERDSLKKDKTISEHYANLIALGYDDALAKETASAMYDNDYQKVYDNQKVFIKAQNEKIKAEAMKKNPTPPAGDPKQVTKESFDKMTYSEMVELQKTNPALYAELTKND